VSAVAAASPILAVMVAVLGLRRPPLEAAALGAGVALLLFLARGWPGGEAASGVAAATAVLGANAAAVILPGLLFVEVTRHGGAAEALRTWVDAVPAPTAVKVVLLVVGLGPFVEGLTGFGVSFVVVVPAALALLPRRRALLVALLSLNIMPWGTLGLSTIVGGQLAGVPAESLGAATALTSGLVFPAAAVIAVLVAGRASALDLVAAAASGLLFSAALWAANRVIGVEIAGVLAGLAVLLAHMAVLAFLRRSPAPPPMAAWPYLTLFLAVLAMRLAHALWPSLGAVAVTAEGASFAPLTSPGLPLLAAGLLAAVPTALRSDAALALRRAATPVVAVLLFLLMSRLMVEAGAIGALVATLEALGKGMALATTAAFGAVAGYMTGSNIGGNALFMEPAAILGEAHGSGLIFAAVQNSASGHAVLASLPMVALLAGLAAATPEEQTALMRFGLAIAGLNALLIYLAGRLLLSLA